MTADTRLNFGDAIQLLKDGARLARTGWNGRGMFIYLVPAASYPVQTGAAKAHFGAGAMVPYNAYLAIKNVDETVSTWVPSVSDCLAQDWVIVGDVAATADLQEAYAAGKLAYESGVPSAPRPDYTDAEHVVARLERFRRGIAGQPRAAAPAARAGREDGPGPGNHAPGHVHPREPGVPDPAGYRAVSPAPSAGRDARAVLDPGRAHRQFLSHPARAGRLPEMGESCEICIYHRRVLPQDLRHMLDTWGDRVSGAWIQPPSNAIRPVAPAPRIDATVLFSRNCRNKPLACGSLVAATCLTTSTSEMVTTCELWLPTCT